MYDTNTVKALCKKYAEYITAFDKQADPEIMVLLDKGQTEELTQTDLYYLEDTLPQVIGTFEHEKRRCRIQAKPTTLSPANDGQRNTVIWVESGAITNSWLGTWGGNGGAFTPNPVDCGSLAIQINLTQNGYVDHVSEGGRYNLRSRVYHPFNPALLQALPDAPAKEDRLSEQERKALGVVCGIKGGYRQDEFARAGLGKYTLDNPLIQSLLTRSLLKANKIGAIQATDEGKRLNTTLRGW